MPARSGTPFATGKVTLSVSSLIFYETVNALWASGLFSEGELSLAAGSLSKYGFEIWEPKGKILQEAARLSQQEGISVYDASYVALALHLNPPLYTADTGLVRKFPRIARQIGDSGIGRVAR